MTRALILALVALTAFSACNRGPGKQRLWGQRMVFDGQVFRSKASGDKADRAQFAVQVNDAGKSLAGAREAARHRANEYCIRQFGRSDHTLATDLDTEDALLPLVNGDLVVRGECAGW